MKIVMMGSGGVGGFFGGHLARIGCDVSFVARGKHLEAMRAHGLTLENRTLGDVHIPKVKVTDDPASLGVADIVILSVKLWDTEDAARAIRPLVGPHTGVLSLQNGVVKDDILRRVFDPGQVMGGVCYVATHIARPGVIEQTGAMQRIIVGEYDKRVSDRVRALHEALQKTGVTAELSDDVRRAIWEKYVFLVGLSATTTTMRSAIGPIRENPQTRAFLHDLMREVVAVGRAEGVNLPPDAAERALATIRSMPDHHMASMGNDLLRGNRLELPWLAGKVVQLGRRHGIPTPPANAFIYTALKLYADGPPTRG